MGMHKFKEICEFICLYKTQSVDNSPMFDDSGYNTFFLLLS